MNASCEESSGCCSLLLRVNETVHTRIQNTLFFFLLLPVMLIIHLDCLCIKSYISLEIMAQFLLRSFTAELRLFLSEMSHMTGQDVNVLLLSRNAQYLT